MDEQKYAIKQLLYLNTSLHNRINGVIEEELLRGKGTQEGIERLKESLEYIIDEQMSRIKITEKM